MNILDFITLINQLLNRRRETKIRKLKQSFLCGDFSINLPNYNEYQPTSDFLNYLPYKSIIPYVWEPRSLISYSKTLIDKCFSDVPSCEAISRNITGTISSHLPQFLFPPNVISNPLFNKSNYLDKDWSQFNRDSFIYNYIDKNLSEIF